MRTDLVERMLDQELDICHPEDLASRGVTLSRESTQVFVRFRAGRDGRAGMFRLDCASFDAQPPSVVMVDPETRDELPFAAWTPGVPHSVHPTLNRPFVCIQGVFEYHEHPSHLEDSWDRYRSTIRLPQTVRRLLDKAGVLA